MQRRHIFMLLGAAIVLAAIAGVYFWQQRLAAQQAAQAAIREAVVARGTIASTVSATGFLAPHNQVNLYFSTASILPVEDVRVVVGQAVQKGDVLAQLDSRDLELEVTRAEQALQAARLTLAQLQAPPRPEDVALAEATVRVAQAQLYTVSQGNTPEEVELAYLNLRAAQTALNQTYESMDLLLEYGDVGWLAKNVLLQSQADQQVLDAKIADERYHAAQRPPTYGGPAVSAQAAVEQTQVTLERLKAGPLSEDVEIAGLQVEQAQAALEVARHNLAGARIVAPFEGVAIAVNIRQGELAAGALLASAQSPPAIVLVDTSSFYQDVAVDEVDIARIRLGQPVTLTLEALPNIRLTGKVEKIALTATNNAGVVSYAVRLALDPVPEAVLSGMTATAEIVVAEARNVLLVPNWAVRRDRENGLNYTSIWRNGVIEEAPVTLGLQDETYSEVISGLAENEVVAVDTTREQFSLIGNGP